MTTILPITIPLQKQTLLWYAIYQRKLLLQVYVDKKLL